MTFLILLAFLGLWFVASCCYQISPIARYFSAFDALRILPRWTFFAPNPGHYDYHVVVRAVQPASGDTSDQADPVKVIRDDEGNPFIPMDWQQTQITDPATPIPCLWNPEKRLNKVITDAWATSLDMIKSFEKPSPDVEEDKRAEFEKLKGAVLKMAPGYLFILNFSQRYAPEQSRYFQFAVAQTTGFEARDVEILMLSSIHQVDLSLRPEGPDHA